MSERLIILIVAGMFILMSVSSVFECYKAQEKMNAYKAVAYTPYRPTNRDWLCRASDEELAQQIMNNCDCCTFAKSCKREPWSEAECRAGIITWLRDTHKEVKHE